jgi:hypothetical protein
MSVAMIPFVIVLATLLTTGLALIVDAIRRVFRDGQE